MALEVAAAVAPLSVGGGTPGSVASWGLGGGGGAGRAKKKRTGPCDHCGERESTQWRVGPPSSPTLCNACGVHWGRKKKLPVARSEPERLARCAALTGGGLEPALAPGAASPPGAPPPSRKRPHLAVPGLDENGASSAEGTPAAAQGRFRRPTAARGGPRDSPAAAAARAAAAAAAAQGAVPCDSDDDSEAAGILISLAGPPDHTWGATTHHSAPAKAERPRLAAQKRRQPRESSPPEVLQPATGTWGVAALRHAACGDSSSEATSRGAAGLASGFRVVTPAGRAPARPVPSSAKSVLSSGSEHTALTGSDGACAAPTVAVDHGHASDGGSEDEVARPAAVPPTGAVEAPPVQPPSTVAAVPQMPFTTAAQLPAAIVAAGAAGYWPMNYIPVAPMTAFELFHAEWAQRGGGAAFDDARAVWDGLPLQGDNSKMCWHRRANATVAASCAAPLMHSFPTWHNVFAGGDQAARAEAMSRLAAHHHHATGAPPLAPTPFYARPQPPTAPSVVPAT